MKSLSIIYLIAIFGAPHLLAQDENEDTTSDEVVTSDEDSQDSSNGDESESNSDDDAESTTDEQEEPGVVVRTEIPKQIQLDGDSSSFKLLSPWSPKPMQRAPLGWQYIPADPSHSYAHSVSLKSGKTLKLKITPYVLAPENSASVVQVLEPGYQPERGYQQKYNIESSLKHSSKLLADTSEALDASIKDLRELLLTLPKPETQN